MNEISKEDVLAILESENLGRVNWFEDRGPRADEAGIVLQIGGWRVYSTDERAAEQYEKVHGDEREALADFLEKVRATNRYFALRAERLSSEADVNVLNVLVAENLGRFNWHEDRDMGIEEAGILTQGAGWRVYLTDEQGRPRYERFHEDEGEAGADFLKRVRAINELVARRESRIRKQSNAAGCCQSDPAGPK
ncbi:hypothetical protein [Pseudarthrobacter sp. MM222]|uniref:hypothetical protein n=1 Tax=Pseudarthrobacter sp. MM222 TaxID=3018929 RepID=UPI0022202EB4|nr:hypothetical protein [Pseudarthrobacter sp. MM222]CAI3798993.1 hypothetical protein NKCBBBOE_02215 [Pseudarthrobacter sp. MM222]